MMDFENRKQHREEMMREVERNHLAKALRTARKRHASEVRGERGKVRIERWNSATAP